MVCTVNCPFDLGTVSTPESSLMRLVRQRIYFDAAGKALLVGSDSAAAPIVLVLPRNIEVSGRTFADLLEISRNCQRSVEDYCLADYAPSYVAKLLADMETAQSEGRTVYLWDAQHTLVLIGYPRGLGERDADWSDTRHWYRTAQHAYQKIHPLPLD